MIYKIYANCATVPNPIKEIDTNEANDLIRNAVNEMLDNGVIEFPAGTDDEQINEHIEMLAVKAVNFFEENGYYDCGDFKVEKTDNPTRPNSCGCMSWLFD